MRGSFSGWGEPAGLMTVKRKGVMVHSLSFVIEALVRFHSLAVISLFLYSLNIVIISLAIFDAEIQLRLGCRYSA